MMAYAESSSALTRDDWAFIDRNVADHGGR
jgi:hypothetical protein